MRVKIKQQRRGFNEIFGVGCVAFAGNSRAKGEAHFERREYGRPQGARTPPPGPCLALSGSPGAEVGGYDSARSRYRTTPSQTRSRYRDRHTDTDDARTVTMQIPTRHARFASLRERIRSTYIDTFTRRTTMDEKRIAGLFGLTLGGLFAISLILSAMSI